MVIGGYNGQDLSDVEMVKLPGGENICNTPADYPLALNKNVGTVLNRKPSVCGSTLR